MRQDRHDTVVSRLEESAPSSARMDEDARRRVRLEAVGRAADARLRRPRQRLRPIALPFAAALLVAVALLMSPVLGRDATSIAQAAERALAAVERGEGILHYRVRNEAVHENIPKGLRPDAAVRRVRAEEHWLDREGKRARSVITAPGQEGDGTYVRTEDASYFLGKDEAGRLVFREGTGGRADELLRSQLETFRTTARNGHGESLGERTLDGVGVRVVRAVDEVENEQRFEYTLYLRLADDYPAGVDAETFERRGDEWVRTIVERTRYTDYEVLARSDADEGLFLLAPPRDAAQAVDLVLDARGLASFDRFDVWWLGERFSGLRLGPAQYEKDARYAPKGWPDESLSFDYTDARGANAILVGIRPKADGFDERELHDRNGSIRRVELQGGRPALLGTFRGATTQYSLSLTLGDSVVLLHGSDKQELLRAAAALRKANR